jgi:hypothetical protein
MIQKLTKLEEVGGMSEINVKKRDQSDDTKVNQIRFE